MNTNQVGTDYCESDVEGIEHQLATLDGFDIVTSPAPNMFDVSGPNGRYHIIVEMKRLPSLEMHGDASVYSISPEPFHVLSSETFIYRVATTLIERPLKVIDDFQEQLPDQPISHESSNVLNRMTE